MEMFFPTKFAALKSKFRGSQNSIVLAVSLRFSVSKHLMVSREQLRGILTHFSRENALAVPLWLSVSLRPSGSKKLIFFKLPQ
jgi:hypothetical protein